MKKVVGKLTKLSCSNNNNNDGDGENHGSSHATKNTPNSDNRINVCNYQTKKS